MLNKKKEFQNFFFLMIVILVMTSQTLIQTLSTPSSNPLIVMMDDTLEEKTTLKTIQKYHNNLRVVKYQSIEFVLETLRSIGSIFYIGHGSRSGIFHKNKEITYDQLSQVRSSHIFFLSCHSPSLNSIEKVDAVEAGIFASVIIAYQRNQTSMISKLICDVNKRQEEVNLKKSAGMFLSPIDLDISVKYSWIIPIGVSISADINLLALALHMIIVGPIAYLTGGTPFEQVWNIVGIILDLVSISSDPLVLLAWAIIKAIIQVGATAIFSSGWAGYWLTPTGIVMASATYALLSLGILSAVTNIIKLAISYLVAPILSVIGLSWAKKGVISKLNSYLNPITRKVASALGAKAYKPLKAYFDSKWIWTLIIGALEYYIDRIAREVAPNAEIHYKI